MKRIYLPPTEDDGQRELYCSFGAVWDPRKRQHWILRGNVEAMRHFGFWQGAPYRQWEPAVRGINLRSYQRQVVSEALRWDRYAAFCGVGSGKTVMALEFVSQVRKIEPRARAIFATVKGGLGIELNPLEGIKVRDTGESYYPDLKIACYSLTKSAEYYKHLAEVWGYEYTRKDEAQEQARKACDVMVVNHDLVKRFKPLQLISEGFTILILDESDIVANGRRRVKRGGEWRSVDSAFGWFCEFADSADYVLIMTATPLGEQPADLWAQMRLVEPSLLGGSKARFVEKYSYKDHFGKVVYSTEQIEAITQQTKRRALYLSSKDAMPDLPESQTVYYNVQLAAEAASAKNYMQQIITADGTVGNHVGLRQLASGFKYLPDGRIAQFSDHKAKALEYLLSRMQGEKVVIWYSFDEELEQIKSVLAAESFRVVNSEHDSAQSRAAFCGGVQYLVAQHQSMDRAADGLQYVCCHEVIYSPAPGYKLWQQQRGRLLRSGQKRSVTVACIRTEDTVEVAIYESLERKIEFNDYILSLLKANKNK